MKRKGSRSTILSILIVSLIIFIIATAGYNYISNMFQPASGTAKNISITIQPGETTTQIGQDLQQKGLIRNALAFNILARVKGLDTKLEAGVYQHLNTKMSVSDIVDQLQNGQPDAVPVQVLDGQRIEQIANTLAAANLPNFSKTQFLNYTENINNFPDKSKYPLLFKNATAGDSMEGLLFPDTYDIPVQSTALNAIDIMLNEMNQMIVNNNLATLAQKNQMNVYQMITLASIVEREAGSDADRPDIASVYWNRLYSPDAESQTTGLLQADPTVQYARDSENPPAKYWLPLQTKGDQTAANSPWNTYTHTGLPPTPICSPNLASLKAAANPPSTQFVYFFADPTGKTHFESTNTQFVQDENEFGVSQ
ncbi:MAG TPA: endolytic transglycosylase MltG [Dictyobacter sp.]|jgi:UPF0755 protein|nr:endolytic transglycosylase MltG [Dictyobacter sp.]